MRVSISVTVPIEVAIKIKEIVEDPETPYKTNSKVVQEAIDEYFENHGIKV